jgi:Carboxypeptidase regulatory-like domain
MKRPCYLFLALIAFFSMVFSGCISQKLSERTDISIHSVHSLDFNGKATIVGVVTDVDGEFLPGASVALFDVDTEALKNEAEVQPDGTYKMTDISPDKYRLRAKVAGFKTVPIKDIKIRANTLIVIDFVLDKNK